MRKVKPGSDMGYKPAPESKDSGESQLAGCEAPS